MGKKSQLKYVKNYMNLDSQLLSFLVSLIKYDPLVAMEMKFVSKNTGLSIHLKHKLTRVCKGFLQWLSKGTVPNLTFCKGF